MLKTCFVVFVSALFLAMYPYPGAYQEKPLDAADSLTLDGTPLTVAEIGANKPLHLRVKTLTLTHGGRIITNGNQLTIRALKIVSDGGSIISFTDAARSPATAAEGQPGKPGTDGGEVVIETNAFQGHLLVKLAGQNGGKGGQGERGADGRQGARGSNGVDGGVSCKSGGQNGASGENGKDGRPGAQGGKAGAGGTLMLKAPNRSQQQRFIDFSAPSGTPGEGGDGGAGGAGGAGGEGGSGTFNCGGGQGGAHGSPGNAGPRGSVGEGSNAGHVELQ